MKRPSHSETTAVKSPIKHVIFDFDGVMADSFTIFAESLAEVLKREPFSDDEIMHLRGLSTRGVIKALGVKPWQLPRLMTEGRQRVDSKFTQVQLFAGVDTMLKRLAEDYSLFIVSTNSQESIHEKLKQQGLDTTITSIYSGTSLFGKAKKLHAVSKENGLSIPECVYVGDETRDIEAAHKVGMRCVAALWGYSTPEALEGYKPTATAETPVDLPLVVRSLSK